MLNSDHFTHLAGNTSFDEEMKVRLANGEDLVALQEEFFSRGRAEAEVVKTLKGYSVRYVSGLHDRALILWGCESYEEAVKKGTAWVMRCPELRSLIVRNTVIPPPTVKTMLTSEECKALIQMIDTLSGGNSEYMFAENVGGGESDPQDPLCSGAAKVFLAAGRGDVVPKVLGGKC